MGEHLREAGIETSMGEKGSALDNAVIESFFSTLKRELVNRYSWPTKANARVAIFEWIEAFYNRQRIHTTLGCYAPEEFERLSLIQESGLRVKPRGGHRSGSGPASRSR